MEICTHSNLIWSLFGLLGWHVLGKMIKNGLLLLHHNYWTENVSLLTDCCLPLTPQGVEQTISFLDGAVHSRMLGHWARMKTAWPSRRERELELGFMVNDLINHVCVIKTGNLNWGELPWLVIHIYMLGGWHILRTWKLGFGNTLCVSSFGWSWSVSFISKL